MDRIKATGGFEPPTNALLQHWSISKLKHHSLDLLILILYNELKYINYRGNLHE